MRCRRLRSTLCPAAGDLVLLTDTGLPGHKAAVIGALKLGSFSLTETYSSPSLETAFQPAPTSTPLPAVMRKSGVSRETRSSMALSMGLSNRGGDVKYLRAWRCVGRVHGCLRGQHRSPHDGASRDEPSMWTVTLLQVRPNA